MRVEIGQKWEFTDVNGKVFPHTITTMGFRDDILKSVVGTNNNSFFAAFVDLEHLQSGKTEIQGVLRGTWKKTEESASKFISSDEFSEEVSKHQIVNRVQRLLSKQDYFFGGFVRDKIANKSFSDLDIFLHDPAETESGIKVREQFVEKLQKEFGTKNVYLKKIGKVSYNNSEDSKVDNYRTKLVISHPTDKIKLEVDLVTNIENDPFFDYDADINAVLMRNDGIIEAAAGGDLEEIKQNIKDGVFVPWDTTPAYRWEHFKTKGYLPKPGIDLTLTKTAGLKADKEKVKRLERKKNQQLSKKITIFSRGMNAITGGKALTPPTSYSADWSYELSSNKKLMEQLNSPLILKARDRSGAAAILRNMTKSKVISKKMNDDEIVKLATQWAEKWDKYGEQFISNKIKFTMEEEKIFEELTGIIDQVYLEEDFDKFLTQIEKFGLEKEKSQKEKDDQVVKEAIEKALKSTTTKDELIQTIVDELNKSILDEPINLNIKEVSIDKLLEAEINLIKILTDKKEVSKLKEKPKSLSLEEIKKEFDKIIKNSRKLISTKKTNPDKYAVDVTKIVQDLSHLLLDQEIEDKLSEDEINRFTDELEKLTLSLSEPLDNMNATTQTNTTGAKKMEEMTGSLTGSFVDMVKDDAVDAAYRVAGNQLTKATKTALLKLLQSKGTKKSQLNAIKELLDSEVGEAAVSYLIGIGLTYAPVVKEDERAQTLAREFRINGMSVAGNAAMDAVLGEFLPEIMRTVQALPVVEKVRIVEKKPAEMTEKKLHLAAEEEVKAEEEAKAAEVKSLRTSR